MLGMDRMAGLPYQQEAPLGAHGIAQRLRAVVDADPRVIVVFTSDEKGTNVVERMPHWICLDPVLSIVEVTVDQLFAGHPPVPFPVIGVVNLSTREAR